MSSAWLLPEHIADVLPEEARHIERLRRVLLDAACAYGYEPVIPPLVEHIESLLSGTGHALDLRTFKLVDQLSGRTLGVRADTTPQVARIDAHLLNRLGVVRLCYCGAVLHTLPAGLHASREPLQFGAEIFGHAGLEADLEAQDLALDCLRLAGTGPLVLDLADTRILRGLLAGLPWDAGRIEAVQDALVAKDTAELGALTRQADAQVRAGLLALTGLYGSDEVLHAAREQLPPRALVRSALDDLEWLAGRLRSAHPEVRIGFDLADLSGYSYYSGARFAVYGRSGDALARGGRYDDIGAVFGRARPAAGFTVLDLKSLAAQAAAPARRAAIRSLWNDDPAWRAMVRRLREQGEVVMCLLPGHDAHAGEAPCDRELAAVDGRWTVRPL
jgi:ATP phosphoribosyltransferase regulatory subunit